METLTGRTAPAFPTGLRLELSAASPALFLAAAFIAETLAAAGALLSLGRARGPAVALEACVSGCGFSALAGEA